MGNPKKVEIDLTPYQNDPVLQHVYARAREEALLAVANAELRGELDAARHRIDMLEAEVARLTEQILNTGGRSTRGKDD